MITKTFEVLDSMTFIPVMAIKLTPGNERDRYVLSRAGFGRFETSQSRYVILVKINGGYGTATCDVFKWDSRTMHVAHQHIKENFDTLESGAVIDVEFLLGETTEPKQSEQITTPF